MINKKIFIIITFCIVLLTCFRTPSIASDRQDLTEQMKDSIVFLAVSNGGYDLREPWNQRSLSENWACACAVGEYEVVTIADKVSNLAFLKALRFGQNEFINAELKVIDYQTNLCLIQLDPNQLTKPLKPLKFSEGYQKGESVDCYWLSSNNQIYNKRGYLDRASVQRVETSYGKHLRYFVADVPQRIDSGEVFCVGSSPIGIACWSSNENETGLIPAETIIKFLRVVKDGNYEGFGSVGFAVSQLLDPAMRSYLKMPESLQNGVYVSDIYTLGTGSDSLKAGDVILKIDDNIIDSYGRFAHPEYEQLAFDYLITSKNAGQRVLFEVWRDGQLVEIQTDINNFKASQMLIPFHEFDQQPEYIVVAGFVLQKLTREYLMEFGPDIAGNAPSNMYYYYRESAYKPTDERGDIVVLSFVLPSKYNLGYAGLGQIIVSKYNGMKIRSIDDILTAQKLNPESPFDVIEFEMNNPTVVIARNQITAADIWVSTNYGIRKLSNINP